MSLALPLWSQPASDTHADRFETGGRTWGAYAWALKPESWAPSIPHTTKGAGGGTVIYDATRKTVFLQFNRGFMANLSKVDNKNFQLCNPAGANWQMHSTDEGLSYSTPKDISAALKQWGGSLVNTGIVLRKGAHAGRLLWTGHYGMYKATLVWYSDDGGNSYKLSETTIPHMDESTLAELDDGTVYLVRTISSSLLLVLRRCANAKLRLQNMRNNHYANYPNGTSCHCRGYARSTDG